MKNIHFSPKIIAGALTLSVLLAGCKQIAQSQQSQIAMLTEAELDGIKDPLIRKHLVAQANVRSYRIVSKSSGRGEPENITEVSMNGNEVKFRTATQSQGKISQEMIVIGDTTYIKDLTDGKWWKQVAKPDAQEESKFAEVPDSSEIKEEIVKKEASEFKQLGKEACGSLTCYKYQEVESSNKEAVRTFWFDDKENLLRKEENKFGEFTSTNTYSYDNINVAAPSPTKDVPSGKSIYEMMVPGAGSGNQGTGASLPTNEADLDRLMEQYSQESDDE